MSSLVAPHGFVLPLVSHGTLFLEHIGLSTWTVITVGLLIGLVVSTFYQ